MRSGYSFGENIRRQACPVCGTHEKLPDGLGCRRCAEGGRPVADEPVVVVEARPEDQYTIPPAADADPRQVFWEPWSQAGWSNADPDLVRRGLMMLLDHFPTLDVQLVQALDNGWTLVEFAYRTRPEKVPPYAIRHLTGDAHMVVDNHAEREHVCRLADVAPSVEAK